MRRKTNMPRYSFPKSARLCGTMRIKEVQAHGKRLIVWPLRAHILPAQGNTQVMIWAPKSLHKHAVDRNLLRRRMREAWRTNNAPLLQAEKQGAALHIAIYHTDKSLTDYRTLDHAMHKLVNKLCALYIQPTREEQVD